MTKWFIAHRTNNVIIFKESFRFLLIWQAFYMASALK